MDAAARTQYKREWDARNPDKVREYRAAGRRKLYAQRKHWLDVIRAEVGCESCGSRGVPLHFHHRNPAEKEAKVTQRMCGGLPEFLRELDKCDLLCVPCHNRTRRSRGALSQSATGFHVSYHTTSRGHAERILALIREATA